jgi:hypothetical protein
MGLFGGIRKDVADGEAYSGITYDEEGILIFSEIDPVLHEAAASGNFGPGKALTSTIDYAPKYFLFNGQAEIILTGVVPAILVGQKILLRFINAGLFTRMPILLGSSMILLSEDGNLSPYPTEKRYCVRLPAGKTVDVMVSPTSVGTMSLFDRRGYVSQGAADGAGTPTQQPIEGLPIPPASGTPVTASSGDGGGGGGGGGCFISTVASISHASSHEKKAPVSERTCNIGKEKQWGIRILHLRSTAENHMLDLRFRVLDPEKAREVLSRNHKSYLIDQTTGKTLPVPVTKAGALRQTTLKPEAGRVYFILFSNGNGFLQQGSQVTWVIGDIRIKNIALEGPGTKVNEAGVDPVKLQDSRINEWKAIRKKLQHEYDVCVEHCGNDKTCIEKCRNVRVNREKNEYLRIIYE